MEVNRIYGEPIFIDKSIYGELYFLGGEPNLGLPVAEQQINVLRKKIHDRILL